MSQKNKHIGGFPFHRQNYVLIIAGIALVVLGFILMMGGASPDPDHFDAKEIFSHRRITLAPFLIIVGYVVVLLAILKKPKKEAAG